MIIKEFDNTTKKTIRIGSVDIDFKKGDFIGGDTLIVARIKDYFNHGEGRLAGDPTGVFSLHAQSPGYELTDPFHDKAQFKALISCMGWHSDDLADIDMPESTWDKYPEETAKDGIEVVY